MPKIRISTGQTNILAISSQVVVGRVGLSIIEPAFSRMNVNGFALPTLLLSSRPGLGTLVGRATPSDTLEGILAALESDRRFDDLDGVLTGYFSNAEQVVAIARHLKTLRQCRPDIPILVDPVIGDDGKGLYVAEAVAEAIRDHLLPVASVATPNRFELSWLTDRDVSDDVSLNAAARTLDAGTVYVTSATQTASHIESRCVTIDDTHSCWSVRHESVPNGTGDLFSGLLIAAICRGLSAGNALMSCGNALDRVIEKSVGHEWLDIATLSEPESQVGKVPEIVSAPQWVAGVDGCRSGWAVIFWDLTGQASPRVRMFATFESILDAPECPCIIAVDMPIGLPEQVGAGGRGPEPAVRKHLGPRQSSVFSIPSRRAVYAPDYRAACDVALLTSVPPRKISKQGYMLFEKIRQVDAVMTPDLCDRIFEVHPELAFWRLNNEQAMQTPKKIKGRVNPDGIAERRNVLQLQGFDADFLEQKLPKGVAADDFVDACACAMIARRLSDGEAVPFPVQPETDGKGITIAIWA